MIVLGNILEIKRSGQEITGFTIQLIQILSMCTQPNLSKSGILGNEIIFSVKQKEILSNLLKYNLIGYVPKQNVYFY